MNDNINTLSIESWNANASMWDELMEDGSDFQQQIVDPALEKMIPSINQDAKILEIACGNGFLARRLAFRGAKVYAIDSSEKAISIANKRTPHELKESVFFKVFDATEKGLQTFIKSDFDYVICNMAFMDIANIKTIFDEVIKLLKNGGSFIVTQTHPCFEKAVGPIFHEVQEKDGTSIHTNGVKVSHYLTPSVIKVKALPQLPYEHLFFHRSLSEIFQLGFQAGFVIDNFDERAFSKNENIKEHNGWHLLTEVPVIMAVRFKKTTN